MLVLKAGEWHYKDCYSADKTVLLDPRVSQELETVCGLAELLGPAQFQKSSSPCSTVFLPPVPARRILSPSASALITVFILHHKPIML